MNLRDQHDWKMLIRGCRTDICSCKISAKVSLMLDNPFLVPSLWKLNHISLCFIQISTKSAHSFGESNVFFEIISGVMIYRNRNRNFFEIISIKTARVSTLSVSYDYGLSRFSFITRFIQFDDRSTREERKMYGKFACFRDFFEKVNENNAKWRYPSPY